MGLNLECWTKTYTSVRFLCGQGDSDYNGNYVNLMEMMEMIK